LRKQFRLFLGYITLICITSVSILLLLPDFRAKSIYNEELCFKVDKFTEENDDIDIVFIGSSKIKHHLNDSLFSELTNLNAFNLGVAATNPPESYIFFEDMLNNGLFNKKVVVLEVRAISEISYKNWWLERSTYWIDDKNLYLSLGLVDSNKSGILRKIFARGSYMFGYFSNAIGLNILRDDYLKLPSDSLFKAFTTLENKVINCELLNRLNQNTVDVIDMNSKVGVSNHFDYLNHLISQAKEKECHLVFYLAETNLKWQINELQPIFNKLPKRNKISIIDMRLFPFINDCSIKHNVTHFDSIGADSLTFAMAKEYLKIKNSKLIR